MNYEKKFRKNIIRMKMEELELTNFESHNLKAIKGYLINGFRYLIKPVNGYVGKYAVVKMLKTRSPEVIYNSDSINFLETALETKVSIELQRYTVDEKKFIDKTYKRSEWLPELNDSKWLANRRELRINRQNEQIICSDGR